MSNYKITLSLDTIGTLDEGGLLAENIRKAERSWSIDNLWVIFNQEHEAVDEGEKTTDEAIAILRKACLDFLKETEPTNKG